MAITKITTPELFDFSATNTALQLPTGDTASRPSAPSTGEWRFNSELKYVEYYDGAAWFRIDTEALPNPDDFPSQNFNVNTYTGNGATQTIDAKFNEAANFNGSSSNGSEISIADANVFSPVNNDLSFSCWIKTTTGNTYVASKLDDSGAYEWGFFTNSNGTIQILCHSSGGSGTAATIASSQTTVLDGNWNQVGFVIDYGNSVTVYVNGVGTTSTSWSGIMTNTSVPVLLGAATNIPAARMLGSIDQVRFFNTAITAAQAEDLWTDETTTTAATLDFPAGAGCIAAYQLDGDASDISGTYGGVETNIGYTGLKFKPDLVWIKARNASCDHSLTDSVRGVQQILSSNSDASEANQSPNGLISFDNNGFKVTDVSSGGASVNGAAGGSCSGTPPNYIAWCFKAAASNATNYQGSEQSTIRANVNAGFSIVKSTTTGSNYTVGHGLGVRPKLVINKNLNQGTYPYGPWWTWIEGVTGTDGDYVRLNSANGKFAWSDTFTTTTTIKYNTDFQGTTSGQGIISYAFADIAGYQKIGSYAGNGSTSGPIVNTGFEPAFVMIKAIDRTAYWTIKDNKRNTSNPRSTTLYANESSAEQEDNAVDFFTNGFQPISTNSDTNNGTASYIYLAIAADKDSSVPTQANSFSPTLYTGNGATQNIYTPFAPDFTWLKERSGTQWHSWYDSIRGVGNRIVSNSANAQNNDPNRLTSFNPNGFSIGTDGDTNTASDTYVSWNWKAGGLPTINNDGTITSIVSANQNAGFSIAKYIGDGGSSKTIGHGLKSTQPNLVIFKRTDASVNWFVFFRPEGGNTIGLEGLNTSNGAFSTNYTTFQPSTTTMTTSGSTSDFNGSGNSYIMYNFVNVAGYQKIGSYIGTGNAGLVEQVGFTPSFLLVKRTDAAGGIAKGWFLLDNKRNTSNPRNTSLEAQGAFADNTLSSISFDFDATSFKINGTNRQVNEANGNYIYLAIA